MKRDSDDKVFAAKEFHNMFFALDIEKDLVSTLNHKHIVQLEEAFDTNEKTKTLIFEFVEGQELHQIIKQ